MTVEVKKDQGKHQYQPSTTAAMEDQHCELSMSGDLDIGSISLQYNLMPTEPNHGLPQFTLTTRLAGPEAEPSIGLLNYKSLLIAIIVDCCANG